MASTRTVLQQFDAQVAESMGVREPAMLRPAMSPIPSAKDIGRRPSKVLGRLAIEQVIPDPTQPRDEFDEDGILRLADSLRSRGQIHPIHVRWSDESQKWIIISGERRWRAARQAGTDSIDCLFHEEPLNRAQVLELQLIENLLREDLKPIEEARAFQALLEFNGWTSKQLAESLRLPPSKVTRSLALLKLPTDLQQQVDDGAVPARTAYELSKIPGDDQRRTLANRAAAGELTTAQASAKARETRRAIDRVGNSKPRPGTKQTFYAENGWIVTVASKEPGTYHHLEQALSEALDEVRLRIANNVRL